MITIKMMSGEEFEISKEEANLLKGKSGLVPLPSLGGMINISSISYILPTRQKVLSRKQNKDGQWCIDAFKNNDWRLENDRDVKVDILVYPELRNDYDERQKLPEINSPYAKELKDKF